VREAALRGSARTYYDLMSPGERQQIDDARRLIEHHPEPDGITTLAIPDSPHLYLYDDGIWQIIYALPDEATVIVLSIAHALDLHS
jgi:ABC-type hemin transport system ATPase subunit